MTLRILGVEILDQTVVAHNVITAAGTDGCDRCFMTHDADWRSGRGGGGCMIHGERASAERGYDWAVYSARKVLYTFFMKLKNEMTDTTTMGTSRFSEQ